jgi:hypothetical protein
LERRENREGKKVKQEQNDGLGEERIFKYVIDQVCWLMMGLKKGIGNVYFVSLDLSQLRVSFLKLKIMGSHYL